MSLFIKIDDLGLAATESNTGSGASRIWCKFSLIVD